ncbi:hypothetical protein EYF80_053077 [Liparis tanakae]|uniref:Uncharacterized protein n=1 Tax=Liparis tanakae TaxID=230148 RepID=A0A4Z2F6T5_9TELE|nr:hypothetical protein EYF80_053077 [Liparis tanakae]
MKLMGTPSHGRWRREGGVVGGQLYRNSSEELRVHTGHFSPFSKKEKKRIKSKVDVKLRTTVVNTDRGLNVNEDTPSVQ